MVLLTEVWAIAAAIAWVGHTSVTNRHKRGWFVTAIIVAATPTLVWARILVPGDSIVLLPVFLFPIAVFAVVGAAWHHSRTQVRAASAAIAEHDR